MTPSPTPPPPPPEETELIDALRALRVARPELSGVKALTAALAAHNPALSRNTKQVREALKLLATVDAEDAGTSTEAASNHLGVAPVEIVVRKDVGRCLVATRAIEAGEVVLKEQPLLRSEPYGTNSSRDAACLKAFCLASSAVQSKILGDMWSPLEQYEKTEKGKELAARVEAVMRQEWVREQPAHALKKALLAFNLNAHFIDGASALFEMGSKLSHSCDPNVHFTGDRVAGCGCHVAIRPIEEGEEISNNCMPTEKLEPTCECQRRSTPHDITSLSYVATQTWEVGLSSPLLCDVSCSTPRSSSTAAVAGIWRSPVHS